MLRGKNKMKLLFIFFILTFVVSAQSKIMTDEKSQKPMFVGLGDRTVFEDSSFSGWFNEEYSSYKINEEIFEEVSEKLKEVDITIVLGTWCSDSRREVLRFLKILDQLSFPENKIKYIFVDRKKKGLSNEVNSLNIEFVPTIIFYRVGEEIGRIIETPDETLEEDLISIVD